jgi:hypothetical protein
MEHRITAAEISMRRDASIHKLNELADAAYALSVRPLLKELYEELSLQDRIWARYDRCCHEGRNCSPPPLQMVDIIWS